MDHSQPGSHHIQELNHLAQIYGLGVEYDFPQCSEQIFAGKVYLSGPLFDPKNTGIQNTIEIRTDDVYRSKKEAKAAVAMKAIECIKRTLTKQQITEPGSSHLRNDSGEKRAIMQTSPSFVEQYKTSMAAGNDTQNWVGCLLEHHQSQRLEPPSFTFHSIMPESPPFLCTVTMQIRSGRGAYATKTLESEGRSHRTKKSAKSDAARAAVIWLREEENSKRNAVKKITLPVASSQPEPLGTIMDQTDTCEPKPQSQSSELTPRSYVPAVGFPNEPGLSAGPRPSFEELFDPNFKKPGPITAQGPSTLIKEPIQAVETASHSHTDVNIPSTETPHSLTISSEPNSHLPDIASPQEPTSHTTSPEPSTSPSPNQQLDEQSTKETPNTNNPINPTTAPSSQPNSPAPATQHQHTPTTSWQAVSTFCSTHSLPQPHYIITAASTGPPNLFAGHAVLAHPCLSTTTDNKSGSTALAHVTAVFGRKNAKEEIARLLLAQLQERAAVMGARVESGIAARRSALGVMAREGNERESVSEAVRGEGVGGV